MTWNGTVTGTDPYIVQVMSGANELSGGLLGPVLLILLWAIIFFANRTGPVSEAAASATWITFFFAILMRLIGVLDDVYLGIMFVLAMGTLVLMGYNK